MSEQFDIAADKMLSAVRKQGVKGVISKRKSNLNEAGKRDDKDPRKVVKELSVCLSMR